MKKKMFAVAGWSTFLVLIGLTVFLFREGLPALYKFPQPELVFAVHPANPVVRLSAEAVRALAEGKADWAAFGGPARPARLVHLANLERYLPAYASAAEIQRILADLAADTAILLALPAPLLPEAVKPISVTWQGWRELFGSLYWSPTYEPLPRVGVWPLLVGSVWVTFIGLMLVVPLGLAMAIYVAEFLPRTLYYPIKVLWEVLAGLPSVVVGFWGLVVVVPAVKSVLHLSAGETAFTAGLLLGWITLPLMASLVEEALQAVPRLLVESSYGLGATRWQTILRLKLPYILPSIATAALLSAGRILGETMVVLMVSGNAPLLATTPFQPVRTLPATLAAELGEAPIGSYHYHVLFFLGALLFLLTLALNLAAYAIQSRYLRAQTLG
ncbi:MAG: phosphate ABC transporter permease subunit PstC [Bacteroidia bacterium]|nr:phosphate ABC transporter permease subunit PstC [Bacteroidia bacterium]